MKQFKIKYIKYTIPIEYKSTFNFQKATRIINNWKKLKRVNIELNLSRLKLKWLPRLPSNLQRLNCNYNQLTSLPPLSNCLKILNCYNNQLTSLPQLPKNLKEIYCGRNLLPYIYVTV